MNTKKNLVSIIVNCFNGEKYLRESLNSVVTQTYKNWELIFCDNQSTDNSKKIFNSYNNKKFIYFKTKKFLNLYEARNFAISKSKGEYLSFLDVDDLWQKNKLEKQIKLFKDPKVGVVYGNLFVQKEKKRIIYYKKKLKEGYIYNELIKNYNIGILTTIIKKKILYKEKIFFNNKYNIIGDFDLFLRLAKNCIFKTIQFPVATYRIHDNNLSLLKRKTEIKEFKDWFKKNKKNLNLEQKNYFIKHIINLEFISLKFEKKYFKLLFFFVFNLNNLLSLKNIAIIIFPSFFLKKIMWFF